MGVSGGQSFITNVAGSVRRQRLERNGISLNLLVAYWSDFSSIPCANAVEGQDYRRVQRRCAQFLRVYPDYIQGICRIYALQTVEQI